jgi:hypothetical protein
VDINLGKGLLEVLVRARRRANIVCPPSSMMLSPGIGPLPRPTLLNADVAGVREGLCLADAPAGPCVAGA